MFYKFLNERQKGQGALEYLLIIGAALIVAVTIIVLVINISSSNREEAVRQEENIMQIFDETIAPPIVNITKCETEEVSFFLVPSNKEYIFEIDGVSPICLETKGIYTCDANASWDPHMLSVAITRNQRQSTFTKTSCRVLD